MTFKDIVDEVLDRLNLSSDSARTRVGNRINDRYRRVTSAIGMISARRVISTITVDPNDIDSILPDLIIDGYQKVLKITTHIGDDGLRILKEVTYDDVTDVLPIRAVPKCFGVQRMNTDSVKITFDAYPEDAFDITVEGYDRLVDLDDTDEPDFPVDFHDILVEGAMADELRKMEKADLAGIAEGKYEARLSDLRMFIAKSAYLDIYQGKNKPTQLWYRPWLNRISMWG